MKITELTEAQKARFGEFVAKWTAIGLETAPANRPVAEAAIELCYRQANLTPPKKITWFDSPAAMVQVRAMQAKISVSEALRECIFGQHDAGWLSFYDYFRDVCGLKTETEPLSGLFELAKHAGWALPLENECLISDRPCLLKTDAAGRLHSLQGPALEYRDGYSLFVVHGVRVPFEIVQRPDLITVQRIEAEENGEIRRVMLDLFGWKKYLETSGAVEVNRDEFGILYKKDIKNDEPLVMVKVLNSTPEPDGSIKNYFLRVPPATKTAKEGVASTFHRTLADYNPLKET